MSELNKLRMWLIKNGVTLAAWFYGGAVGVYLGVQYPPLTVESFIRDLLVIAGIATIVLLVSLYLGKRQKRNDDAGNTKRSG